MSQVLVRESELMTTHTCAALQQIPLPKAPRKQSRIYHAVGKPCPSKRRPQDFEVKPPGCGHQETPGSQNAFSVLETFRRPSM